MTTIKCRATNGIILALFCIISLSTLLWGVQKDLPVAPEVDEFIFVEGAIHMASSGNLNPGWFGNPGSTTFYPLALIYHIWHAIKYRGSFFHPDPNLLIRFQERPSEFYILGRLLTIAYGVMSVFLVYKIAYSIFEDNLMSIAGAGLSILYPVSLFWFQWVRTDSSGLFYGLLALWLCLLAYQTPTKKLQIFSGIAIGLAIASRYFLVTLVPVYLIANLLSLIARRENDWRAIFSNIVLGIATTGFVFVLSTPFFFADFSVTWANLQKEARSTQLGWDGLSPLGNLAWYCAQAIPQNLTWPQMALSMVGVSAVLLKRHSKFLLLLVFIIIFWGGISISPLHSERWIIQILPLFSLFAVFGLYVIQEYIFTKVSSQKLKKRPLIIGLVLISLWPIFNLTLATIRKTGPSTRILAREWILEHLPSGSSIVEDKYTVPCGGTSFRVYEQSWSPPDHSLEFYISEGYEYFLMNETFYNYFLAEPQRYSTQLEFYDELFEKGEFLYEITPSLINEGSVIRIYELPSQ